MRVLLYSLALLLLPLSASTMAEEQWILEAPVTMEDVERAAEHRHVCFYTGFAYKGMPWYDYYDASQEERNAQGILLSDQEFEQIDRYLAKQQRKVPLQALLSVLLRCKQQLDLPVSAKLRGEARSGHYFEACFSPPLPCRIMGRVQQIGSILLSVDKPFLLGNSGRLLIGESSSNPTTIYVYDAPVPEALLKDYVKATQ